MGNLWVLGAADPEMERIESVLAQLGEETRSAEVGGARVQPGNAYKADQVVVPSGTTVILVECCASILEVPQGASMGDLEMGQAQVVVIDHHRAGDPGAACSPAEFLLGSSLGQVISYLAKNSSLHGAGWRQVTGPGVLAPGALPPGEFGCVEEEWYVGSAGLGPFEVPSDLVLAAASDHCPAQAYRGECPGVDPDALMKWRVAVKAIFQAEKGGPCPLDACQCGRQQCVTETAEAIEAAAKNIAANVAAAVEALSSAPEVTSVVGMYWGQSGYMDQPQDGTETYEEYDSSSGVKDLRGEFVPELPETALCAGLAYVAGPIACPDGRQKIVMGGCCSPEQVEYFMELWAPAQGLVNIYGVPARAFAGGYLTED